MEGDYLHNRFMFLCVGERQRQTQNEIEVSCINLQDAKHTPAQRKAHYELIEVIKEKTNE